MRGSILFGVAATAALFVSAPAYAQDAQVSRGKYLVEQVARCPECHTPRTETGELDRARWMKGATLAHAASTPAEEWRPQSPDITSTSTLWSRWGQDAVVNFLATARNPRGVHASAPMPPFTMRTEDAAAVVAYLKTVP